MGKNSFSAEQIGYFGKPTYTEEGIKIERIRHQRIDELGIQRGGFSSGEGSKYTDDEREALRLIYADKEVPEELAARIKEYNRSKPPKKPYKMKIASPKLIRILLGIKEKDQRLMINE